MLAASTATPRGSRDWWVAWFSFMPPRDRSVWNARRYWRGLNSTIYWKWPPNGSDSVGRSKQLGGCLAQRLN